jgi:hypothetical protein
MNWQQVSALAVVAVTAVVFLWQRLRPRKFSFARDTHCGCTGSGAAPKHSVIYHARKGARPEIYVKIKQGNQERLQTNLD